MIEDSAILAHYVRVVKELRKISIPGFSCLRCGSQWTAEKGDREHHAKGCVLEGTEEKRR
jgi:hypothetical protein